MKISFITAPLALVLIAAGLAGCVPGQNSGKHDGNEDALLLAMLRSDTITFVTSGSSFSPVVTVTGSPEIEWTWADGTTGTSASPTKDYGTAGTRTNALRVTPWSAVQRINIGYDAGDGGDPAIETVPDQQVASVRGLNAVAPHLQQWCSSYNEITSLDFSNFKKLETIECYCSSTLENVKLNNTPALKRACFEDCNLTALDLSGSPSLQDLRGALNVYTTINFGTTGSDVWHICTRDNPQITNTSLFGNMSQFPKIEELWIWNDNQYGALNISSTGTSGGVFIYATQNHYTSANFSGALQNTAFNGIIFIDNNDLASLNIDGCIQLTNLDASNNNLGSDSIDYILETLDSLGRTNGVVDLSGNTAPASAGLSAKANLISKGWTVTTD